MGLFDKILGKKKQEEVEAPQEQQVVHELPAEFQESIDRMKQQQELQEQFDNLDDEQHEELEDLIEKVLEEIESTVLNQQYNTLEEMFETITLLNNFEVDLNHLEKLEKSIKDKVDNYNDTLSLLENVTKELEDKATEEHLEFIEEFKLEETEEERETAIKSGMSDGFYEKYESDLEDILAEMLLNNVL